MPFWSVLAHPSSEQHTEVIPGQPMSRTMGISKVPAKTIKNRLLIQTEAE